MPVPIYVVRDGQTGLGRGWRALLDRGLATEQPPVSTVDIGAMALEGRLGVLAAWRLLRGVQPVDKCVLTSPDEVRRVLGHLSVLRKQLSADDRAGAWVVSDPDAAPSEAAIHGLPVVEAAVTGLDPEWDVLCLAATDPVPHAEEPASAVASVPGVSPHVLLARLRFLAATKCYLVSRRGAEKLLPLLEHVDTGLDRVIGLGAHVGLLRVYGAEAGVLGGREPFVSMSSDAPRGDGPRPPAASHVAGIQQPDGLVVFFEPWSYVPVWASALLIVSALAVVALGIALGVLLGRRRTNQPPWPPSPST